MNLDALNGFMCINIKWRSHIPCTSYFLVSTYMQDTHTYIYNIHIIIYDIYSQTFACCLSLSLISLIFGVRALSPNLTVPSGTPPRMAAQFHATSGRR